MRRLVRGALAMVALLGASVLVAQAQAASPTPIAASTLRLPNGKVLSTAGVMRAVQWQDVAVLILVTGAVPEHPYGLSAVGNHSRILSQTFVETPDGKAWFALNERTPPAAEPHGPTTYEYWAVMARPSGSPGIDIDYCVEAVVTGDRQRARAEVLGLLAGWRVPAKAGDGGANPVITDSTGIVNPMGTQPTTAQANAKMVAATDPGLPRIVGYVNGEKVTAKVMAEAEMFLSGFTGRGMGSAALRKRAFEALVQQFVPQQVAKAQGFFPPLSTVKSEAVARGLPTTKGELLALQATEGVNAMRVHYTKAHGDEESAWEQYVASLIRAAHVKILAKF